MSDEAGPSGAQTRMLPARVAKNTAVSRIAAALTTRQSRAKKRLRSLDRDEVDAGQALMELSRDASGDEPERVGCINVATWTFKGGTGKTTSVVEIADRLVKVEKKRVGIVDLDSQATLTQTLWSRPDSVDVKYRASDYSKASARRLHQLGIPALEIPERPFKANELNPSLPHEIRFDLEQPVLEVDDRGAYRQAIGAGGVPLKLEDKLIGSMIQKWVLDVEDPNPNWAQVTLGEWIGVPLNNLSIGNYEPDYPNGELLVFPGGAQIAALEEALSAVDHVSLDAATTAAERRKLMFRKQDKAQMINRLAAFFRELAHQNALDFLFFDLSPAKSALNKWIVAHISDVVVTPVKPEISSVFSVSNELLDVLPKWFEEVEAMNDDMEPCRTKTRLALGPCAGRRPRDRPGLPRILPLIIMDYSEATVGKRRGIDKCAATHMASMDWMLRYRWPLHGAREQSCWSGTKAQVSAKLRELYLPDGQGRMVVELFPHARSLNHAHEMGHALCSVNSKRYEDFFSPLKNGKVGHRGVDVSEMEKEREVARQRFRGYAKLLVAYADRMLEGEDIGSLFAV